jgi:hypothetical protein
MKYICIEDWEYGYKGDIIDEEDYYDLDEDDWQHYEPYSDGYEVY